MVVMNGAMLAWNEHLEEHYGEGLPEMRWEATMVSAPADANMGPVRWLVCDRLRSFYHACGSRAVSTLMALPLACLVGGLRAGAHVAAHLLPRLLRQPELHALL
jgi:hypothetical protein